MKIPNRKIKLGLPDQYIRWLDMSVADLGVRSRASVIMRMIEFCVRNGKLWKEHNDLTKGS